MKSSHPSSIHPSTYQSLTIETHQERWSSGTGKPSQRQTYQIHGDGVRGDKLGSVYQAVCPSHLDSLSFGWGSVSDAVEVLKGNVIWIRCAQLSNKSTLGPSLSDEEESWEGSRIHLDVLREEIVAVGAVVKHDLVEGGRAELQHLAVVVAAVLVFAYDPLTNGELLHCSLAALWRDRKWELLSKASSVIRDNGWVFTEQ